MNFTLLLNRTGDTALTWKDPNDLKVLTYFENRMKEGYSFFIIDPEFARTMGRKRRMTSTNEIGKERKVFMDDEEAERLFKEGSLDVLTLGKVSGDIKTARRAKTPTEAATNATVAIRPMRGG